MLTEKDYCDLDTSHELWIMGLEPDTYYDGPIILLYEAQKWLREVKKIAVFVTYDKNTSKWFATVINMNSLETINMARCDLYEEALSEGILDAVEILKDGIGE